MIDLHSPDGQKAFLDWLRRQGAEVLAATNPYEVARFRARGGVHVVYVGRRGITASGFANACLIAFDRDERLSMGITKKPRTFAAKWRAALVERDGKYCFYCAQPLPEDDMTIEHLVSRDKGGPDHMDNLALAHGACNKAVDNLPLVAKIARYYEARR